MKYFNYKFNKITIILFAILVCITSVFSQTDYLPAKLGEEKYQELKAKGLLPQPKQVLPPVKMRPDNIISPDAIERREGLLIPLDEGFSILKSSAENYYYSCVWEKYDGKRKSLAKAESTNGEYYYSGGKKIYLNRNDSWIVVQLTTEQKTKIHQFLKENSTARLKQTLNEKRGFFWLEISSGVGKERALQELQQSVTVVRMIPAYLRIDAKGDTSRFIMTDEFHVKFHPQVSRAEVEKMNKKYGVEILSVNKYNEYLLQVIESSKYTALEIANIYYESDLTVWSLPNFFVTIRLESINDPLFPNQWHLHNTGQGGGTRRVDINATPSWSFFTSGSSAIVVAVIDDGVEMHEDFYAGQLVMGYTTPAAGGGNGAPGPLGDHGQAVAGIVAANYNNIGVCGVANNIRIMPIRIFEDDNDQVPTNEIAGAIDTAWTRGAHILNCSWWCDVSDNVTQAIDRAHTLGRGGRGCLVVKSAGNTGANVTFPGTVPGVLTVGAVTNQNQPASYTPRDPRVDVVAPSSGGTLGITTIDRMGNLGYNNGNYTNDFGGTSAAAPQVSGIGALILSINPNLDARPIGPNPNPQVQNIIMQTADNYGTTNWDGSGRVNAHRAVLLTSTFSVTPFTNGTPPEYRNDDFSTSLIPLSFPFTFYGTQYNRVYINNNGNLSFEQPYSTYTSTGFPITGYAMVSSFWADVDTRTGGNTGSGIVYYKSEPNRFTVIWDRVGYYGYRADKLNTFEIVITDGTDPLVGVGKNVCFSYGDMQWTTGSASGGVGGFGGTPATVGANMGDGVNYALIGRFDHEGYDFDGAGGNPDGVSYLDWKTFKFNISQGSGTISGTKFRDDNENCVKDAGEPGLQGWTIRLEPGSKFATTNASGNYFFSFLEPNTYTVSEVIKPNWQQTCPPSPGTHTVVLTQGQTVTGKDFGNKIVTNAQDLFASVAGGIARPGFQKFYGIKYENKGTININGTVKFTLPSQVSHLESSPGGIYNSGTHQVTWDVGSLPAGFTGWLWTKVQIPNTIPLWTTLTSHVVIEPIAGDLNPADNYDSETQVVRGSFDPNDKQVTPQGIGPFGTIHRTDSLEYLIRFQNTGTDTAFNITIRDLLDEDLDVSTVIPGASSHSYAFGIVDPRELVFIFSDINLPDSNVNEPASHGFVKFKIHPRSDVSTGSDIVNSADIYFDFNPPITTNIVSNRIGDSTMYRTFSPESLALAKDNMGKIGKPMKRGRGMPNAVNVLDAGFQLGVFPGNSVGDTIGGMVIGKSFLRLKNGKYKVDTDSAKKYGWLRFGKWDARRSVGKGYNDVLKSLYIRGKMHDGPAREFDFKRQKTSISPTKHNNKLLAEQIALKVNILASLTEITQEGFGELMYYEPDSIFSGSLLRDIAMKVDSALTLSTVGDWDYDALERLLRKINRAFEGPIDSISFIVGNKLKLTGIKALSDIPFLQPSGVPPPTITPVPYLVEDIPDFFSLNQNYPNPFNPTTTIEFTIPSDAFVTLKIYNILGQEVNTLADKEYFSAGLNELEFDANRLASGVYFYRILVEGIPDEDGELLDQPLISVKKMILMK